MRAGRAGTRHGRRPIQYEIRLGLKGGETLDIATNQGLKRI
jgi:hypothetical protein